MVTRALLQEPQVGRDHALALLREMLRIRRFEEKCAELYSAGKIQGFLHLYIGEEAVAVGSLQALTPEDAVVSTYREHGHALARGLSPGSIMAEMYGKANGCCRGRGGSMHLFDAGKRFYGGWAIVGGHLPLAVGLALADKLPGRPQVTACFFGAGAVAEGRVGMGGNSHPSHRSGLAQLRHPARQATASLRAVVPSRTATAAEEPSADR